MNLFEEYKALRSKYGVRSIDAKRIITHRVATRWRRELRGWDFDQTYISRQVDAKHEEVWRTQMPNGNWVSVEASYDTDNDGLDGLCEIDHRVNDRHTGQEVISHADGEYIVWTNNGYVKVTHCDGGLETGWYRKSGYAKQPAILKAIESRKKQIEWIEGYLQGNVNYLVLEVKIYPPEYGDWDRDNGEMESLASAGPLGGVECDDEDYYIETLNELYEEALSDLK